MMSTSTTSQESREVAHNSNFKCQLNLAFKIQLEVSCHTFIITHIGHFITC